MPDLLILLAHWGECECPGGEARSSCVQYCIDRFEPGSSNFERCIEWCDGGALGEFVSEEEEEM